MTGHDERAAGIADAQQARTELYGTLGQLQERLNYAKRFDNATERLALRIEDERRDRPFAFAAGVAVVGVAVGAVVWAVANSVAKRLK